MGWFDIQTTDGIVIGRFPTRIIDSRYWVLHSDLSEPDEPEGTAPTAVRALGAGGFGAVVAVHDRIRVVRAVKIVDPNRLTSATDPQSSQFYTPGYQSSPRDTQGLSERLEEEIRHTNALPFKHIVPIIDYGEVEDARGVHLVYYVSPFIGGLHFDEYFQHRIDEAGEAVHRDRAAQSQLHDSLLILIDDFLAALAELADAGVSHLDVKPRNTKVLLAKGATDRGQPEGLRDRLFVIDLGAAVSKQAKRPARTLLITTPYFFPVDLLADLEYSAVDGMVSSEKLLQHGPKVDLYAVGRSLELALLDRVRRHSPNFSPSGILPHTEPVKEALWRAVLAEDFEVIEGFTDRLLEARAGFVGPREAQLAFQSIARHVSRSILSSSVLTDRASGLVINAGGTLVRVAPPLDRVVNHPVFQRLRRLNQLALISEQFPDATHTRFSHSLKVYDLMKRFVLALNHDPQFRLLCTHTDVDQMLAAALVHDIGQYPFSHTIEDLRKLGDLCDVPHLRQIQHDQEVAADYLRKDDARSIWTIFENEGYNVDEVLYMFQKTPKDQALRPALNIGRDLVSGVIDVDRLSYLRQDSERTGVRYGGALDAESLGEALCIHPAGPGIAVEERGISAVEAVLAAVYWMYRNVYWRPANRGFMAAVKHVMEQLLERNALTFRDYLDACFEQSDWDALLFLDRQYAEMCRRDRLDWHDPLATIVAHERYAYTRVFSLGLEGGEGSELYDRLIALASPRMLRLLVEQIQAQLPSGAGVRFGEVLVDVPLKKRLRSRGGTTRPTRDTIAEAASRPGLMVRRKRKFSRKGVEWVDLYDCSPLALSLGKIEDHSGRKIRVFFSNQLLNRLPAGVREQLADTVFEVVKTASTVPGVQRAAAPPRTG